MNFKTTEQIKKGNDYKHKVWIEATGIYRELDILRDRISDIMLQIDIEEKENGRSQQK